MTHTCICIRHDPTISTTFTPNTTWDRPLLLCADHARRMRQGYSFMVYPLKERT